MLDASNTIESVFCLIYADVDEVCAELEIDYLVVGAAARDLVLEHIYGARSRRATEDIDFGLRIAEWRFFETLRAALLQKGYRESSSQHRLVSPKGIKLDIVPFGDIADANANVLWPPDGEVRMSVLGFTEAYDNSELIRIQKDPDIRVRVASPVGMSLLKLIAWNDRSGDMRRKDALDLQHLLLSFHLIPEVRDAVYVEAALGERHEWDVELMSAELLGQRAGEIAQPQTAKAILAAAADAGRRERLSWEMANGVETMLERSQKLLLAFFHGFGAD